MLSNLKTAKTLEITFAEALQGVPMKLSSKSANVPYWQLAHPSPGGWILDRYKSGLIADPTEGVRWLTQAYQLGFSMNALVRLGLFYVDEGRGEWQDRSKSFALFGQCIGYASANCQFAYAYHLQHGFGTPSDPAKSYTYYEVARVLGAPRAPERLQALDRMLSSDEKAKAVELAKSIRSELRPIPTQVIFQYAGNQPPSPWSARIRKRGEQ